MGDELTLVERLRAMAETCCAGGCDACEAEAQAADRIKELEARYHREQDRIERLIEENEYLRDSLEMWIFHNQRAMGQKPDVARQYAKAWLFRNAGGKEPE